MGLAFLLGVVCLQAYNAVGRSSGSGSKGSGHRVSRCIPVWLVAEKLQIQLGSPLPHFQVHGQLASARVSAEFRLYGCMNDSNRNTNSTSNRNSGCRLQSQF